MEHLKAELEIRGYWNCANSLPKVKGKCKEVIEQIKEECARDECFVDPKEVLKDIASLRSTEGTGEWMKPLALMLIALVTIETFVLTFLALDYMKYKADMARGVKELKENLAKLNKDLWLFKNLVRSSLAKEKAQLEEKIKEIMWELKALELALSYLQHR